MKVSCKALVVNIITVFLNCIFCESKHVVSPDQQYMSIHTNTVTLATLMDAFDNSYKLSDKSEIAGSITGLVSRSVINIYNNEEIDMFKDFNTKKMYRSYIAAMYLQFICNDEQRTKIWDKCNNEFHEDLIRLSLGSWKESMKEILNNYDIGTDKNGAGIYDLEALYDMDVELLSYIETVLDTTKIYKTVTIPKLVYDNPVTETEKQLRVMNIGYVLGHRDFGIAESDIVTRRMKLVMFILRGY